MNSTFAVPIVFLFIAILWAACATEPPTNNIPTNIFEPIPSSSPADTPTARPSPEERIPRITLEELKTKYDDESDILIVDSRSKEEYETDHIAGAISAPLDDIINDRWTPPLDKDTEIVFYCT